MEYFVRTSHIVSGLIYLLLLLYWSFGILSVLFLPENKQPDDVEVLIFGLPVIFLFFTIVFSSIHYIVLKKFHPWAKITEENETQIDKVEYTKVTDEWNIKVVIRNGAIFGSLYSGVMFLHAYFVQGVYDHQEPFWALLFGNTLGGAIGGVLLFGIVAVIRNKFIVRK